MTADKLYTSYSQYHHSLIDQSLSTVQTYNTIGLTLKMTSAQVVETLVTNNSSPHNPPHPDDHTT